MFFISFLSRSRVITRNFFNVEEKKNVFLVVQAE